MITHRLVALMPILVLGMSAVPARAQWAVVDAPAIAQLVQEVNTLEQAVQTARDQLSQAQQALRTMTGNRGMERLGVDAPRNYLPSSWSQLDAVMSGTSGFIGLTADMRNVITANAILTPSQLTALAPMDQRQIEQGRQTGAIQQALVKTALATTSGRFATIQGLIGAIARAGDQKAILDLQARISAELGMLQNEQTKLQLLHQASLAQDAVNRQREREAVIAGQGRFESRFAPVP